MTSTETRPLWAMCTMNDNVLSEDTPPDTVFEYVDISNVTKGHIAENVNTYEFRTAPSRARRVVSAGDVVVSTVRTYLRAIAQVPKHMSQRVFSTGFAVLRPGVRTDSRYLAYVLGSRQVIDEIVATSVGVSYPAIQGSALHRIRVPHHRHDAQIRIADHLDRETGGIDVLIGKLDDLADQLKALHRTNLVALGHKLCTPGESARIGLLLTKQSRAVRQDDGVVTAFRDGQVALRSRRREEGFTMSFSEAGYQGVEPGDLVFHGLDGFAGAVGVSEDRGKVSPVCHVCTATTLASERFMAWALRALAANEFLEAYAFSVRQRSVDFRNWTTFAGLPITYVPLDEQVRIADRLDDVTAKIDAMLGKVAALKALLIERRTALITDVVNGWKEVA